jgi:hypothetical protein
MTYNPCENTKITYSGNGSQTDFTFQFTYTDETDVIVWLYDDLKTEWIEQTNKYVFAGPTIIRFITAPPRPTNAEGYNIIIGRRTNVSIMEATFYPGSSIRAQDLNDNFEQLRAGIEDGRCELNTTIDGLKYDYWGKKSVSKRDSYLADDPPNDTTYREDQEQGYWNTEGENKSVPTTGAVSARLDPYVGDALPPAVPNDGNENPGKLWINTREYWDSYWEPAANAWVAYVNTGPRGQDGSPGDAGEKGDTGFAAVIGKIGPGAWEEIVPQEPVVGALYIAVETITGFPGGGVPESQDALGFNGDQWINYGLLGDLGPVGPEGPEGEQGPVGPAGGVNSVNGLQGDVEIGVEELSDFAYYPASNEGTLEGPLVDPTDYPTLKGGEFFCGLTGGNAAIWFSKENTQLYDILKTLKVGEPLNIFYNTSYVGYGWEVRKDTTFVDLGVLSTNEDNWAFVVSGDWTGVDNNGFSTIPGQPSGGPIRFESDFITNGSVPLESGQALIYDKTTERWRPEDVKLNISALPLLP